MVFSFNTAGNFRKTISVKKRGKAEEPASTDNSSKKPGFEGR